MGGAQELTFGQLPAIYKIIVFQSEVRIVFGTKRQDGKMSLINILKI